MSQRAGVIARLMINGEVDDYDAWWVRGEDWRAAKKEADAWRMKAEANQRYLDEARGHLAVRSNVVQVLVSQGDKMRDLESKLAAANLLVAKLQEQVKEQVIDMVTDVPVPETAPEPACAAAPEPACAAAPEPEPEPAPAAAPEPETEPAPEPTVSSCTTPTNRELVIGDSTQSGTIYTSKGEIYQFTQVLPNKRAKPSVGCNFITRNGRHIRYNTNKGPTWVRAHRIFMKDNGKVYFQQKVDGPKRLINWGNMRWTY